MVTSNDVKNIIVQILTNNFFELLITIYFSATPPEQNTLISKSIRKACTKTFFYYKNIIQMIWTTAVYILKQCLHKAVF